MQRFSIVVIVIISITLASCYSNTSPKPEILASTATITPKPSNTPEPNLTTTALSGKTATAAYLATNKAMATKTAQARMTIIALTPSRTPRPTVTGTPTINPTQYLIWAVFENKTVGVGFEYPHYFNLKPYSDDGCVPSLVLGQEQVSVTIGQRIGLTMSAIDQSKITLSSYAAQKIKEFEADSETSIEHVSWGYVSQVRSVTIEYRFGAFYRYGVETYFMSNDWLYTLLMSSGATCDLIALSEAHNSTVISEFDTYWHILSTLHFLSN